MKRAVALGLAFGVAPAAACELAVADAWVREAPPGAAMAADYGVLKNRCSEAVTIDGVSAAPYALAEIHRSYDDNGIMRMEHLARLTVPAGGEVVLASGGLHLMLMRPARPVVAGDAVTLELRCGKTRLQLDIPVRKAP